MTQCVPNTDRTQAGLEPQPSSQEKSPVGCDYLEGCLEAVAQPASVTQGLWLGGRDPLTASLLTHWPVIPRW